MTSDSPGEVHAAFLSDTVAHGDEGHVLICLHAHFLLEHLKRLSLGVGSRHNDKICPERGAGPDALGKVAVKADDDADFPEVGLIDPESVIRGRGIRKAPEFSSNDRPELPDIAHFCKVCRPSIYAELPFAILTEMTKISKILPFVYTKSSQIVVKIRKLTTRIFLIRSKAIMCKMP